MLYTIKKGKHYCQWTLPQFHFHATGFKIRFSFDQSCLYSRTEMGQEWADLNKLYGISLGLRHHKNSFRIAWRANDDHIELFSYWYDDGVLHYEKLSDVSVEKEYAIVVDLTDTKASVTLFDKNAIKYEYSRVVYNKSGRTKNFIGYVLRPYFGGTLPAPKDMSINIYKAIIKK